MPVLPAASDIQALLDATGPGGNSRPYYLGASEIGHKCSAYPMWSHRGFDREASPRSLRIFELGHRIEGIVLDALAIKLRHLSPPNNYFLETKTYNGQQFSKTLYNGHVVAHPDGILYDTALFQVAIVEVKSMASKYFAKLKREGLSSMRQYHWQVHSLMGMFDLQHAYFIAYNKDTSEYHVIHEEYDPFLYARITYRMENILDGHAERIGKDDSFWMCKMCHKKHVCWNPTYVPPTLRCQQCQHAMPNKTTGKWTCQLDGSEAVSPCSKWTKYEPTSRGKSLP